MPLAPDYYTEQLILTAILNEKPVSSMLFSMLSVDDFMSPLHSRVFQAAKELHSQEKTFGMSDVYLALKNKCPYQFPEIYHITENIPDNGEEVVRYVPLIKENRKRMNLVRLKDWLSDALESESAQADITKIYTEAAEKLHQGLLFSESTTPSTWEIFDQHFQFLNRTPEEIEKNYLRVSDWYEISKKMPFERGCLYGIAARPGGGKSAALIHMMTRFAMAGLKGIYFSIEMNRAQVCNRILANIGTNSINSIKKNDLRFGKTTKETREELRKKVGHIIKNVHIVLMESVNSSIIAAEMFSAKHNMRQLDFVLVDYLQIIEPGENKSRNRYQEIGSNCRDVRKICQSMNAAGIIGIQVGRKVEEGKEVRKIKLSDMRESGDIENHLDGCIAINITDVGEALDLFDFDIIKNREGETGAVAMEHKKDHNIIGEVDNNQEALWT